MTAAKKTSSELIIGAATTVRGRLFAEEDLVICGRLEGELEISRGLLTVERGAVVLASVRAGAVRIGGAVVGRVEATDVLHLLPTARVVGDVSAARLIIEAGAQISGMIEAGELAGGAASSPRVPPREVERAPIELEPSTAEPIEPIEPSPGERRRVAIKLKRRRA